jgi:phosphonate transport system permease protein
LSTSIHRLPPAQLEPLLEHYDRTARARQTRGLIAIAAILAIALVSGNFVQADLVGLFTHGDRFFNYFERLLTLTEGPMTGRPVWTDPGEWFWGLGRWMRLLLDTLLIAYAGTLFGALAGFCCAAMSARNIVPSATLRWSVKRLAEFCRTVPDLVFALLFVYAFGLGALPGVMAVAIHTTGALGKQLLEVVENIEMNPVEGVVASGSGWARMVRFAVIPQVLPSFLSYALMRFEINVRTAAVLGFVGAGGIGQELIIAIRRFYYNDVAALLVLITLSVILIDILSSNLRRRVSGMESRA